MKITAIILAAGISRRMNRDKLSLEIDGRSLLQHVLDTVRKAHFHEVILVHSPRTHLPRGHFSAIVNDDPGAGVSRSMALALAQTDPDAEGIVFLMGDQPFLSADTLKQLKKRFAANPSRIVIPVFDGSKGSPVVFPASLREELAGLAGETGGRQVIDRHPDLVVYEVITRAGEGLDIDTRDVYHQVHQPLTVLVRGAGDLATGVIHVLYEKGYRVIAAETANPSCIRTEVSFAAAIHDGRKAVEGVTAVYLPGPELIDAALAKDLVPLLIDPDLKHLSQIRPDVLVDAIIAKKNLGTTMDLAPLVIALGPGFTAGLDCHAVIETMRGDSLADIITRGSALPNTGVPGLIAGEDQRRVIHSPADGILHRVRRIGDIVDEGDIIAMVDEVPVKAKLRGTLRGLIFDDFPVQTGLKIADIDPREDPTLAFTISDKAIKLGEAVARAIHELRLPDEPKDR